MIKPAKILATIIFPLLAALSFFWLWNMFDGSEKYIAFVSLYIFLSLSVSVWVSADIHEREPNRMEASKQIFKWRVWGMPGNLYYFISYLRQRKPK